MVKNEKNEVWVRISIQMERKRKQKKGEKHNKIFIHANIPVKVFESIINFYVVFSCDGGKQALDSNTISSVICWSCQWLFGENCSNLFHYFFSLPSPSSSLHLRSSLYIKHAVKLARTRISEFINKRKFIIVSYMCCCK